MKYSVKITVTDGTLTGLPGTLTINVVDCNDPPEAKYVPELHVWENRPLGTLLTKVKIVA